MISAEVPNWIAAIELAVILVLKMLWGGDLMVTEAERPRRWRHVFVRAGSLWLGVHFAWEAVFLYGAIAFVLISDPQGGAPTWFAVAMAAQLVVTVLAWLGMAFTPAPANDGGDDDA